MASSRLPLLALFLAAGCLLAGPAAAAPPPTAHALSAAASVLQGPVAAAPERPAVVWQTMDGLRGAVQADLDASPDAGGCLPVVVSARRSVVAGDIAHYVLLVRTGPAEHDLIRVHRVVKETRCGLPIRTPLNVFLQHGDAKDFTGMFLPGLYSPTTPDDFGFAVFAARRGVDVWGIDQAWNVMPQDLEDYGFVQDWGMARQVRDLGIAMRVARLGRLATGSGGGPMILSGYSSGVFTTVAFLDAETRLPRPLRNACGWIPVDLAFKTDDPQLLAFLELDLAWYRDAYASGMYAYYVPFRLLSELTRCCPADDSPVFPGFTNEQAALYFSSGVLIPPVFHYWAGGFDTDGMPTGLTLVDRELWLDFLGSAPLYEPLNFMMECDELWLGRDSPHDDHLGEITVPVFNVSPLGGFGELTRYGIGLLGSSDVEHLFPSIGTAPELDMGHIDIWTWAGAAERMWLPMVDWIGRHCAAPRPGRQSVPLADGTPADGPAPAIETVAPNPSPGAFRVSLGLAGPEPVRLEVVDVAGRTVWSRDVAGSGRHQVEVGGGQPLAPGVYLLRAAQGAVVSTRRVAVVR